MNFDKLDIYGFKSFADKVEIKFENGITAIVGPNGCGKSNVADSIRFVMGEQSAKSMRGSSMMDVIFNGTEKRSAQSYCEVSLYFNNKNKIFDLEYEEVILTRKLYKNGESEYLINKTPCRRKDVIDAFRTIGLGKESYCVIGQGKIDSILSAKPEDRRNVFEESAGISKFKEEKQASLSKLDRVNENLTRINDIILELEKQLGPLKSQAENAKIFLELSNRLKELEVNLYVYEYDNSFVEKSKINSQIDAINEELALKQSELEKAIRDYDFSQDKISELDDIINELRNELLNLSVALEKQNGEVKLFNEKLSVLKEQNEKLLASCENSKIVISQNEERKSQLELKKEELDKDIKSSEFEIMSVEANYNSTIEKLSFDEANAENLSTELYMTLEKQGDIKSTKQRYETELESLKQRQSDLLKEKDSFVNESQSCSYKMEKCEEEVENLENKIEKKQEEKKQYFEKIEETNSQIGEIQEEIENKKAEYHSSLSKFNVLSDMKEYNEGFAIGVKRLLEQAKNGSSVGGKVIGVVAELMQVPSKYEVAIEMALGASVQNIVTKNEDDARSLIEYLKVNKFGRVTFLPVTSVKERTIMSNIRPQLSMRGVEGIASELISFDSAYSKVFNSLLGSTVVVDNLENATMFAKATGFSVKIVTLDGDIISTSGSMSGGSRKENTVNIIGRDREIADLSVKLENLKVELENLEENCQNLRAEALKYSDKVTNFVEDIHALELEKVKQNELYDSYEERKDEIESLLAEQDITFNTILDKIDFVENQLEMISKQQLDNEDKKSKASAVRKQTTDSFAKLRLERDELLQKLSKMKIDLETKKNNLENVEKEIERLGVSNAQAEYDLKENTLEIQKNNQEIDFINQNISEVMTNSSFASSAKKVELVREKITEVSDEKKVYQQKMNDADGNKMLLNGEIQMASDKKAKCENQIVKIETELENLQNRVWEEYQMTYGDAKKVALENFDAKEGQNELGEIKRKIQRLGNVNLSAIEDIKAVSERYDDMSKQRDDLVKAQQDLNLIINDLTSKMEVQFKECFDKIRSNFQVVFRELFGGGRADITLEDEKNILECGINIIAEPPGKKLQNITLLSGGEKALTAVAILFSILKLRAMPFCVLDEIEAALDDANVERYAKYLHRFSGDTQFIVITHRKPTMELADSLYGVTMEEKGVSKVVSVKLSDAIKLDNAEN